MVSGQSLSVEGMKNVEVCEIVRAGGFRGHAEQHLGDGFRSSSRRLLR
jgi:hypothetical protein